ncbi:MAG: S8 family serine peptidase [Bacteroidota bacterium]
MTPNRVWIVGFLCVGLSVFLPAQSNAYWIHFSYKGTVELGPALSDKSLQRRDHYRIPIDSLDFPVNPTFLSKIRADGGIIKVTSRWQNAALVLIDTVPSAWATYTFIERINALGTHPAPPELPNRLWTEWGGKLKFTAGTKRKVAKQEEILQAEGIREIAEQGRGLSIAVLDVGFRGWNQHLALSDVRVSSTWDFLRKDTSVHQIGFHGTQVLSVLAAQHIGICPAASYHLFRTELESEEFPAEMYYWIAALEKADSLGVDLVCSSLGYNFFDAPNNSLEKNELDGKTLPISLAAETALSRGMLVVVSAGNEGKNDWQLITAPADSYGVVAGGALNRSGKKVAFSSKAAPTMPHPIVYAVGKKVVVTSWHPGKFRLASGTSYAAPQLAGWLACMLKIRPEWSPKYLQQHLFKQVQQSPNGTPNFMELLNY